MPLSDNAVVAKTRNMLEWRAAESQALGDIYLYLRGRQDNPVVPANVPLEIRRLSKMARVNLVKLAIDVPAQSMYVAGYRSPTGKDEDAAWEIWQKNRLDARQTAIHRAGLAYGISYATVLPGEPTPVIRGVSPRYMTTVYSDDESWPVMALEVIHDRTGTRYRLYDEKAVYSMVSSAADQISVYDVGEHDLGVTPVVRFRNVLDLDDDQLGEVEPLMPVQDQIDKTTFDLLVAQHFQSFRQRYILGWTTKSEEEKIKIGASKWLTFENKDVTIGELGQVDLTGYLDSRSGGIENLATISQTPPHHLLGKLVNLSAEALVAAESGQRRKISERVINFGESWEQVFRLAAIAAKIQSDDGAQVRWQDTEARSFSAMVDALGKLAQQLGVPEEELWERIPGVTQQDINRWKAARAAEDAAPAPAAPTNLPPQTLPADQPVIAG